MKKEKERNFGNRVSLTGKFTISILLSFYVLKNRIAPKTQYHKITQLCIFPQYLNGRGQIVYFVTCVTGDIKRNRNRDTLND